MCSNCGGFLGVIEIVLTLFGHVAEVWIKVLPQYGWDWQVSPFYTTFGA
jgi:hypothetical protein